MKVNSDYETSHDHDDHRTTIVDTLIREDHYLDSSYDWANNLFNWGHVGGGYSGVRTTTVERDDKNEGQRNRPDGLFEEVFSEYNIADGDFYSWLETDEFKDVQIREEVKVDGQDTTEVTLTREMFRDYDAKYVGKDSGFVTHQDPYGGGGYTTSSWNNQATVTVKTDVDHLSVAEGVLDPNHTGDPYGGGGGSNYYGPGYYHGYFSVGFPGGGEFPIFTDYYYGYGQLQLTDFSGHHDVSAYHQNQWSWNNTGDYRHYQSTPSGSRTETGGYQEDGEYTRLNDTGQVDYSGTGGSHYSINGPHPHSYDHTNTPFSYTLQVDMSQLYPSLGAVNWDSATREMIRHVTEQIQLIGGDINQLIDEARLYWDDFGGNFEYNTYEIRDQIDTFKSGLYGAIDGFLDTVNPFDYYWSIPDIGPVAGHETAYTVGYVGGVGMGVGVQIGIGILSGGATAPACVASIAKLGLTAAKAYTVVDTLAGVATGIGMAANTYNNAGNMSGWQIAGNAAMAGLSGASGLGHLGGAAMKKLSGPINLGNGGCFVAGTKVKVDSLPLNVEVEQVVAALSGSLSPAFRGGKSWGERVLPHVLIPIESVPLGARIGTINPQSWDYDDSLPEPDSYSWSKIELTITRDDGVVIDAELLRPDQWILDNNVFVGSALPIHIAELDVHGIAQITGLAACEGLASGLGEAVTGRFVTRQVGETIRLTLIDGTVLEGTPVHPIWSVDRDDFVEMSDLQPGERLQTSSGPLTIASVTVRYLPVPVYNIEVRGQHVYEVSDVGVLVHNAKVCSVDTNAPSEIFFRTMSQKEYARAERAGGLVLRQNGSSELGITLNESYVNDLASRFGNARRYAIAAEIEVKPGTFNDLISQSAVHPSAAHLFPDLPLFKKGMTVPQVKLEKDGVVSILLGSSREAIKYFNERIIRFSEIR